jgi:hypothetical protein
MISPGQYQHGFNQVKDTGLQKVNYLYTLLFCHNCWQLLRFLVTNNLNIPRPLDKVVNVALDHFGQSVEHKACEKVTKSQKVETGGQEQKRDL